MSAELDLDDVAGTSPKARRELDELRARLTAMEAQSAEAGYTDGEITVTRDGLIAAARTLIYKKYTYHEGAELWKPPLGKAQSAEMPMRQCPFDVATKCKSNECIGCEEHESYAAARVREAVEAERARLVEVFGEAIAEGTNVKEILDAVGLEIRSKAAIQRKGE